MTRTEAMKFLTGPIPTLRTPFTREGDIDFTSLRRMIDFDIEAGARVLVLTAGDSHYEVMSDVQIETLTRTVLEHVNERVPVVTADRRFSSSQAVSFARHCRKLGSAIHMLLPPDWAKSVTPETLAEHYRNVAEEMPVMIVTNIFISRGHEFGMRTIELALEKSDNIVAIKDDMCGLFAQELAARFHDTCAIWAGGRKQNHMSMVPFGAHGYLSTFMTFHPETTRKYWRLCQSGDLAGASRIIADVDIPFFNLVCSMPGGFDAGLHGVLEIVGLAERWRPRPYLSLPDKQMEILKQGLGEWGIA